MLAPTGALAGPAVKLNGPLVAGGLVEGAQFSPDSSRVAYVATQNNIGTSELFSVPSRGGSFLKLNPTLVSGGDVQPFGLGTQFSPDSSHVLYVADQNTNGVFELFSVPSAGGPAARLNSTLVTGGEVGAVQATRDSARALYVANQNNVNQQELFSVPLTGGAATRLNGTLVTGGNVTLVAPSPDSSRVLYLADQNVDEKVELFSVPSGGGTAVKLNGAMVAGGDVQTSNVAITNNSSRVVYLADQNVDEQFELFSVPLTGGAVTRLNGALPVGGDVQNGQFAITADSSRVVYMANQNSVDNVELFSVPVGGGTSTRLNGSLVSDGNVLAFFPAPDSSRVAYAANQTDSSIIDLFSVPTTGGTALNLTPGFGPEQLLTNVQISADSSRAVYTVLQDALNVQELFSVPMTGGAAVKLNAALPSGGQIDDYQVTPDSTRVVYRADQDTLGTPEIYIVPITGGTPVKLNVPLPAGGHVVTFQLSPDGKKVIYLAPDDSAAQEVFVRFIANSWNGATGNWDDGINWDSGGAPDVAMATTINTPATVTLSGNAGRSAFSLQVGGGTSSSVLELQSGAGLTVTQSLTIANNGVLRGDGLVVGSVINQAGGEVRAGGGESLRFSGNTFSSSGSVEAIGTSANLAEIEFDPNFSNAPAGLITASHGTLRFNNGLSNLGSLTISGGENYVFGNVTNSAAGKVILTGNATTTFYGTVSNNPGTEFHVSTGSTGVFLDDVTGLSEFTGTGVKIFEASASAGALVTPGSTIVDTTGGVTADFIRENALSVFGSASIVPNGTAAHVSHVSALTITNGILDLADNHLIVDTADVATIASYITSAFDGGVWTGPGLTSSAAAAIAADGGNPHKMALGYATAASLGVGSFDGQSVNPNSMIVRYTFDGDANLDGKVNALDFNALATGFGSGEVWFQGDFNYDGMVNSADFTALGQNFGQVLASPPLGSVVPEPLIPGTGIILAATVLRRRRSARRGF